jgi:hypothetical protein
MTDLKTLKVNLTHTNPQLIPLYLIESDKSYVSLSMDQIASVYKAGEFGLKHFYKALGGGVLTTDDLVTCQYKNGGFVKSFGPGVYKNKETNELYLEFGKANIVPIAFNKGVIFPTALPETDLEASFVYENPYGTGDDLYLKLTLVVPHKDSEVMIVFFALVRRADLKVEIDKDALESMVKRFPTKFKDLVGFPPSGNKFDGPLVKLSDLPVGSEYQVIGYRSVETGYGKSYIIRCLASGSEIGGEEFEVWANSSLKAILEASPIATPESPAKMKIIDHKERNNKTIVSVSFVAQSYQLSQSDNDFELDTDF